MKRKLKHMVFSGTRYTGACSAARFFRSGPIVLFYHGVEETILDPGVQTLHLSLRAFEKQIDYLQKHFDIISLDDLHSSLSTGHKLDPAQVVITFDDGYKNNRDIVLPYLASRNVPFALFVSTRHICEGVRFPTYYLRAGILHTERKSATICNREFDLGNAAAKQLAISTVSAELKRVPQQSADRIIQELIGLIPADRWEELDDSFSSDGPMNWDDVKYMHEQGVCIGSHCHDHFILHGRQTEDDTIEQLRASKALIGDSLGKCDYIAYPNGRINDICADTLDRVRAAGYLAGFTTIGGEVMPTGNPFLLPRISASIENIDHFVFAINSSFRHNGTYARAVRQLA